MIPAPRRLVLLDEVGNTERVLAELPAAGLHDEIRRQAAAHPGRLVAGEYQLRGGWRRFLIAGLPLSVSVTGHHEADIEHPKEDS
jgi:hypothetical protein